MSLPIWVADRQKGSSSLRIRDTHSTHNSRVREQTRNIQCLPRNQSLSESGESKTGRIIRDRSESIKIPVFQCCRNSPVSASWGTCKTFLSELESNYTGSLDPSINQRDRNSHIIKSFPGKNSDSVEIQIRGTDFDRFRNREFSVEKCGTGDNSHKRFLLQQRIFGTEEGGRVKACNKSKKSEQFSPLRAFQNGGDTAVKRSHGRGRLVSKTRFKRCVPDNKRGREISKISEIFLEKQNNGV